VSENKNCCCAGTIKDAVKFMGRNAWRQKPWGLLGKHTQRVWTWLLGQTVPSMGTSNREGPSPTVDSYVGLTFSDNKDADQRRLRAPKTAVS